MNVSNGANLGPTMRAEGVIEELEVGDSFVPKAAVRVFASSAG